jgi:hypothetical protein
MTQQQFIEEIKRLSIEERITLLEVISRSLREDLETNGGDKAIFSKESPVTDAHNERESRVAAVHRLQGIIKFDGEPPSDEELKEDYAKYLTEKYS